MKRFANSDYYKLTPGERTARNMLGLGKWALRTQDEVATIMGCTRQNVQQLERSALRKIRQACCKIIEERKWTNPWP